MPEAPRAGPAPRPEQAPPPDRAPQLVLGFDFGRRRIGVACGDTLSRSAAPLGAIAADASGPDWPAIDALIGEWQPAVAVVGLPYNLDDSEGVMAAAARAFAAALAGRYHLSVDHVDERYSSLEAGARLRNSRQTGARKRRVSKIDVDAAAACVILERWFTQRQ
jgi:putative Holliday junction resolvase